MQGSHAPAPGMVLVAAPDLTDPHFARTVVYLVAHNEEGTLGIVLNRRTETAVFNVLPDWATTVTRPQALYSGGPVQTTGAMCLGVCKPGTDPEDLPGMLPVAGSVVMIDLDGDPDDLAPYLRGARIFAGHAGWSPGQLEEEIARDDWFVVPGEDLDVIAPASTDLWFTLLRRQGFPLAWTAYRPADVHAN